jgi:hypothetical protein
VNETNLSWHPLECVTEYLYIFSKGYLVLNEVKKGTTVINLDLSAIGNTKLHSMAGKGVKK